MRGISSQQRKNGGGTKVEDRRDHRPARRQASPLMSANWESGTESVEVRVETTHVCVMAVYSLLGRDDLQCDVIRAAIVQLPRRVRHVVSAAAGLRRPGKIDHVGPSAKQHCS